MSDEAKAPEQQGTVETTASPIKMADFGQIDYSKSQMGRFYANHAAASVTYFDIRLAFSAVQIDQGRVMADDTLTVLLSPELANIVHAVLGRAIENYVKTYGPLRPLKAGTADTSPAHEEKP